MKLIAKLLLGLLGLVVVAAGVLYLLSGRALGKKYTVTPAAIAVTDDSATIARGEHLIKAVLGCRDCHGENLAGTTMAMGPVGRFAASNLTGGQGSRQPKTDAEWELAVRHGVRADGSPLVFMPSKAYSSLSDEDLAAVIAYVRSRPPVDNVLPALTIGPIGRMILATNPGQLLSAEVIDHGAAQAGRVPPGRTLEYGEYLTRVGGCTFCHGDALKGGLKHGPPGTPPSADLTATGPTAGWTETEFRVALQEGKRPDGTTINPFMPYRTYTSMSEEEVGAIFDYVRRVGQ